MLGTLLEVAIALILIYLILSLLVSNLRELLAMLFAERATVLRNAVAVLFSEYTPAELTKAFYEHPLIKSLSPKDGRPSYLPSDSFTLALLDLVCNGRDSKEIKAIKNLESLLAAIKTAADNNALVNDDLIRQLQLLLDVTKTLDEAHLAIEKWFNNTMDRATGWYKRRTQLVILACALALTIAANVDSIMILNTITNNGEIRNVLNAAANELVNESTISPPSVPTVIPTPVPEATETPLSSDATAEPPDTAPTSAEVNQQLQDLVTLSNKLSSFNIVGWCFQDCGNDPRAVPTTLEAIILKAIGYIITILAVTLGAPFWFDLLKKLVNIRGTVAITTPTTESPPTK